MGTLRRIRKFQVLQVRGKEFTVKTYTKGQVEAIMLAGYHRGFQDGRAPRDRIPKPDPPKLEDLGIDVPLTSSDDPTNMAHKRPWLDKVGATKP